MHFKHILYRRIATANRFADDPTCRFCGIAPECSTHLAVCIATEPVFEFIEGLIGINLRPGSEVAQRLFCYQVDRPHPSSGYLGILAWRYILTDFYNIQYGNADGRSARSILRAILTRYHLLVTARIGFFQRLKRPQREKRGLHAPSDKHLRKIISPLYTVDKDFNLETSENLSQAARELDIRHIT